MDYVSNLNKMESACAEWVKKRSEILGAAYIPDGMSEAQKLQTLCDLLTKGFLAGYSAAEDNAS